jgi:hypothetical protein
VGLDIDLDLDLKHDLELYLHPDHDRYYDLDHDIDHDLDHGKTRHGKEIQGRERLASLDPDLCRNTMKYRNTHKRRDAAEIRLHFINNK